MKTATVTWITYNNYGTELQAFALQHYLEELGVENIILSDSNIVEGLYNKKSLSYSNSDIQNVNNIASYNSKEKIFFRGMNYAHKVKKSIKKRRKKKLTLQEKNFRKNTDRLFEEFKRNKLKIQYNIQQNDLELLNNSFDAFICGSDQIWSLLKQNFDPYFFLNFVTKKKIAYAASVGVNTIDDIFINTLKKLLSDFDYLSVREKDTSLQLTEMLSRRVDWVVDPTLLYNKAFWVEQINEIKLKNKKEYLLCYFLENKDWYFEYALDLAEYMNLKLIIIPSRKEFFHKKYVYNRPVGPLEFVKLIEQASFVLTDSYHGALFSINFNKQFVYLKRFFDSDYNCQNVRIYSILNYLKLSQLIIENKKFEKADIKIVDYNLVNPLIDGLREKSKTYIYRSLFDE